VRYPTEPADTGWVGLSEITLYGDHVYIIERDNQIGDAAKLKKLYRVALSDLKPAALGGELPTVAKEEVRDFIPDLKATGGYLVDKIEGFTIDVSGTGYAVTDNDGVDDSNGETCVEQVLYRSLNLYFLSYQEILGCRMTHLLQQYKTFHLGILNYTQSYWPIVFLEVFASMLGFHWHRF
jgi:hypothetical protein